MNDDELPYADNEDDFISKLADEIEWCLFKRKDWLKIGPIKHGKTNCSRNDLEKVLRNALFGDSAKDAHTEKVNEK